jgi:hypothetical protein
MLRMRAMSSKVCPPGGKKPLKPLLRPARAKPLLRPASENNRLFRSSLYCFGQSDEFFLLPEAKGIEARKARQKKTQPMAIALDDAIAVVAERKEIEITKSAECAKKLQPDVYAEVRKILDPALIPSGTWPTWRTIKRANSKAPN